MPCATNIKRGSKNDGGVGDVGGDSGAVGGADDDGQEEGGCQLPGLRFVTSRSLPRKIPG